jgi:hypothetical protein
MAPPAARLKGGDLPVSASITPLATPLVHTENPGV